MSINIQNYIFTGRKPSKAQIIKKVKQLANAGANFISISWGENWIDLLKSNSNVWSGTGWIEEISGDLVARELTNCRRKELDQSFGDPIKFLKNHFTVISIK